MALTPQTIDELHEQTKKLLELWMKIKLALLKAFAEGSITREQEANYLQVKSEISRIYRIVSERLTPGLKFDGEKMMEMLKNAMTLEHLSQLPAGERQANNRLWHAIYIKLTRTLGALEIMKAGYYPNLHRVRLKSHQATKATKS